MCSSSQVTQPTKPWTPPLPALPAATVLIGVWLPMSLCGEAAPQGIEEGVMHWEGCGVISPSSGQALVTLLPLCGSSFFHYKQSTNVCPSFQDDPLSAHLVVILYPRFSVV